MSRIRFLNFFNHPVICYKFLNTLYSLVKPTSDFKNCAALRSVVTERSAAITERNTAHLLRGKQASAGQRHTPLHEVRRSGTEFGAKSTFRFVIRKKCGVPLRNTEKMRRSAS